MGTVEPLRRYNHGDSLNMSLEALMIHYDCTQQSFAEKIGVTQPCLSQILNGKRKMSFEVLYKIHDFTGLSYDYLINDSYYGVLENLI